MEMQKKEYNILQNMIYILRGTWQYNKTLLFLLGISAITGALAQYIWIVYPKFVIDLIEAHADRLSLLRVILIISIILLIVSGISKYTSFHVSWRSHYVRMKYILKLSLKQNTMDFEFLENPRILNQAHLADHGSRSIERMLLSINSTAIQVLKILFSITILLTLNPLLIFFVILLSVTYYIVLNLTIKRDKQKSWDLLAPMWRKIRYTKYVNKDFDYAKDVRLYDMEHFLMEKQKEVNEKAHTLVTNSKVRWIKFGTFYNCLIMLLELALYIVLIYYVLKKDLSIGNFLVYIAVVKNFFSSLNAVLYSIASIERQSYEINDYRTFIEYEIVKNSTKRSISEVSAFCFEFINVSFQYPGQDNYALKNLNLVLNAKSHLAIVGMNGAGKSTFIKLLLRLYEPTEGMILLDGIPIAEFDKQEYYTMFAPLFQNVELYAFPLSENVSMKSTNSTDKKKAQHVLCMAGFKDKLYDLSKGVDTEVLKFLYDDGVDFSGGERQKLVLARALYKEASVVVLDEPTSALDALAEYELYHHFDHMVKDKTAVYISHRLSSTRFCDSIAMFDNGQIIEMGTHDELLRQNGAYKNMFDVQARYYQEETGEFA